MKPIRVESPDLRLGATLGDLQSMVDAAVAAARGLDPLTIVGHSGAGFLLPFIAEELGSSCRLCFVDAGVPEAEGESTPSRDFLEQLRQKAVNGVLPKWSTWWGAEVVESLIPDVERRAEVELELPNVSLSLYERLVRIPPNWRARLCSYILLSEGYRNDATLAESMGWSVATRLGGHLDLVNTPHEIGETILELASVDAHMPSDSAFWGRVHPLVGAGVCGCPPARPDGQFQRCPFVFHDVCL